MIWTDVSSFSTASSGRRPWVIRKVDEKYHPDCSDKNFHTGRKTKMVWVAFCGTTKSELIYIPRKVKIDSIPYVETVLEPALLPYRHRSTDGQLFKKTTLQDTKSTSSTGS